MSLDRSWIDRRIAANGHDVSDEYKAGVDEFLDFAYSIESNLDGDRIKCPCASCKLLNYKPRDLVTVHLYKKGFLPNYKWWAAHGEMQALHDEEVPLEGTHPYIDLVMDAVGPDFDWSAEEDEEEPNFEAKKFFKLMKDADEPLWDGCMKHTKLSAVAQLLNCKVECNMTDDCFERILTIIKSMLPESEKLPETYYKSKQVVEKLGLGYQIIHACANGCMLYYKENEDKQACVKCGAPRFKESLGVDVKQKKIPQKILRYFPITPRLQRLYMSPATAQHMTWHEKHQSPNNVAIHPSDCEAWKHFDRTYPSFAAESRN